MSIGDGSFWARCPSGTVLFGHCFGKLILNNCFGCQCPNRTVPDGHLAQKEPSPMDTQSARKEAYEEKKL